MLCVYVPKSCERPKGFIENVTDFFDFNYLDEWFNDEFVKRIVKEVDNADVQSAHSVHNEFLGTIPVTYLSSGCKSLILQYKMNIKTCGDRLGDNCIPLLLEISKLKDVQISLGHIPDFPNEFTARFINNNKITKSLKAFIFEYIYLKTEGGELCGVEY